jgi:hypothetical protein
MDWHPAQDFELANLQGRAHFGMKRQSTLRITLCVACPFNLGAALVFAMPSSRLGTWLGLPHNVPALYASLIAFFVGLFGVVYGWLAMQREFDRSILTLAAIGKLGAFLVFLCLWLAKEVSIRIALLSAADLAFAAYWLWWLQTTARLRSD